MKPIIMALILSGTIIYLSGCPIDPTNDNLTGLGIDQAQLDQLDPYGEDLTETDRQQLADLIEKETNHVR